MLHKKNHGTLSRFAIILWGIVTTFFIILLVVLAYLWIILKKDNLILTMTACVVLFIIYDILYFKKIFFFIYNIERKIVMLRREKEDTAEDINAEDVLETFQNLIQKEANLKLLRKQAEMEALQSQINPHFLYNTLETIRGHALVSGNVEIAELTKALADIFRYSISQKGSMIRLEEEVSNLHAYMKIQQIRFAGRFALKVECEDETILQCLIPKLSLQPILENSIKYGLAPRQEPGEVRITITSSQTTLYVKVHDNGIGMTEEKLQQVTHMLRGQHAQDDKNSTHIGLANINDRLKMLYGDEYGVFVESMKNIGTTVILRYGLKWKEEDFADSRV